MNTYKQTIEKMIDIERPIILKEAERSGRFYGNENRPKPNEDVGPYVENVVQSSVVLHHRIKNVIGKAVIHFKNIVDVSKAKIEDLERIKSELRKKRNLSENRIGGVLEHSLNTVVVLTCILGFILFSESYFNGKAFQVLRFGLPISIMLGCGLSFVVLLMTLVAEKTLAFTRDEIEFRITFIAWVIAFTALFYSLGQLRNSYLIAKGGTEDISLLSFILFNWSFLIASGYILSKLPSYNELVVMFDEALALRRIVLIDRKIREIDKEIAQLEAILIAAEQELKSMPWYEESTRRLVESIANEASSKFMSENLQMRTDGLAPYPTSHTASNYIKNPLAN